MLLKLCLRKQVSESRNPKQHLMTKIVSFENLNTCTGVIAGASI